MAQIGVETVVIKADSASMESDLNRAGARVKQFGDRASKDLDVRPTNLRAIPEMGEKVAGSFHRMEGASRAFDIIRGNADVATKSVAGLTAGVESLQIGLAVATRMATGFKAAFIGTGIGLAVLAIGHLISKLREEDEAAKTALSDAARAALSIGRTTVEAGTHGRVTATGAAGGTTEMPRLVATIGETLAGIDEITGRFHATMMAGGRSADRAALARAERVPRALELATRMGPLGDSASYTRALLEASRARIGAGHAAVIGTETVEHVRSTEDATRAARDMAATLGHSEEEAALYRASLHRTTVAIGEFSVETTAAMSPAERLAERMRDLAAVRARTGAPVGAAERAAMAEHRAEVIGLERLRMELSRAAGAREALAARTPFESYRVEADRLAQLLRDGSINADTFRLRMAALTGTADPLRDLMSRAEAIADGWRRGTVAAIDARRAITTLVGVTASPLEALGDRLRAVRMLTAAGAVPGAAALGRRATGEALLGLAATVRMDLPPGVEAAAYGSVEAVRAINAAQRAGPTDPVERVRRALEIQTEIERQQLEATNAVARALTDGIFRPFLP